jgi:hypothetical protein
VRGLRGDLRGDDGFDFALEGTPGESTRFTVYF